MTTYSSCATNPWRRSSRCNTLDRPKDCIELKAIPTGVLIRSSTTPQARAIATKGELAAFFAGVKSGEFDDLIL